MTRRSRAAKAGWETRRRRAREWETTRTRRSASAKLGWETRRDHARERAAIQAEAGTHRALVPRTKKQRASLDDYLRGKRSRTGIPLPILYDLYFGYSPRSRTGRR
jgi:hypothetical protein